MTLEEALPLLRSLSVADKLRLIDELAKELLEQHQAGTVETSMAPVAPPFHGQPRDPHDEDRWTTWLDSVLDAAGERIATAQREMRACGILDDTGELATSALPADMQAGSKTSVTTG
ncbi:MAG TPA: hypothetical protein VLS89_20945 [Candidatus Nanopelagicales bacterium]|nr:hypothetical protein [Candidatus Nanopelagicales bacterium]